MIAVIAHDAGGAEILSSYVRQQDFDICYVLEGPARKIFERKLGPIKTTSLREAISRSTSIISSTSWESDIEFDARKLAHEYGKTSVAFLDHWINYQERFIRAGEMVLPDEIWVGDILAEAKAREIFPSTPVRLVENPYFQDIRTEVRELEICPRPFSNSIAVLYVCEPIGAHALFRHGNARIFGYVEEDAINYFLSNISILGRSIERIVIRPHPSEPPDKYAWVQQKFNLPIQYGGTRSLLEEIAESDLVVGCESMAMVVAILANKKVISCIPPNGRPCVLPQAEIFSFYDILKGKRLICE